jgi:hypothetical protein
LADGPGLLIFSLSLAVTFIVMIIALGELMEIIERYRRGFG